MILKTLAGPTCLFAFKVKDEQTCSALIEKNSQYLELGGIILALFLAARYLGRLYDWWMKKADDRDAEQSA